MRKIISFVFGILLFSGLPVLGWGITDISGFISNPERLFFIIMMAVLNVWVVLFVPEEGRSRGEGKKPVKRQRFTILILQIIPLFIVLGTPFFDRHGIAVFGNISTLRITGLILALLGFVLMNWSVMTLGKQFSADVTIQEDHKLITDGPYRLIRHPRYLGILLFLAGISLVFRSWIAIILVLITLIVILWRIRDEEKLMRSEFKQEWENYAIHTKSLIPFIY